MDDNNHTFARRIDLATGMPEDTSTRFGLRFREYPCSHRQMGGRADRHETRRGRCAVGVLDRFEKGVERVVNNAFAKADRKSTRLNSSHVAISYAVFCLKKKKD